MSISGSDLDEPKIRPWWQADEKWCNPGMKMNKRKICDIRTFIIE
jgi:hypothetical protein